ncbi:MAG: Metal-dependent hydrolase YbeY, involved in rRNA and/or ribosome maturation and assembly [uncultured Thiotrichaceae bacterium]|uniref:Endoribonuclease YbeY n=1 Tax=uncultured Thiotrichaceae bacterium TaxID=298394 RepID=A0A6S6SUA7_9GAMM|nr:MAG: Metal-dependent hydrolase YbeY, involved in rRNA and/or ribosome maturation and assembly [uncultured Thiotrichaceae bacterium]
MTSTIQPYNMATPTANSTLVEIDFQNPQEYQNIPELPQLEQWANIAYEGNLPCTVTFRVVNNTESQTLNHQYRGKDHPTNILSFPFEAPPIPMDEVHLGDLVACYPVINSEAQQQNKNNHDHWAHLMLHGMLHLQGYDHISEEEADIMESLEIKLLDSLHITNPYI